MTTLLGVALYYLLIGAGVLGLLVLTEVIAVHHHGMSYRDYMSKTLGANKEPSKGIPWASLLLIVAWPILLWSMLKAFRQGKSFFQVVAERKENDAKKREALEKALSELEATLRPRWIAMSNGIIVHANSINRTPKPTHVVVPSSLGGFIPCRTHPLREAPECLIPIGMMMAQDAAKRVCEEDKEWLELANDKTRHRELERQWKQGVDLFHTPVGEIP
mgnify:CR=1 FL=1|jgi:hypothetical protein